MKLNRLTLSFTIAFGLLAVASVASGQQPGDTFSDCDACPQLTVVPPGSFRMGDPSGDDDSAQPVHTVQIGYTLAVGTYEVTRSEFAIFAAETGHRGAGPCLAYQGRAHERQWHRDPGRNWREPGYTQSGRDPAVCVNWQDAQDYAAWLSRKTGRPYRLLSEAEWEYAARAGGETRYGHGDDEAGLCSHANAADRGTGFSWRNPACDDGFGKQPAPVGSLQPNAFGLYDMYGNVWEWVADCWNGNYRGAPGDGSPWTSGGTCDEMRMMRGGSWYDNTEILRAAYRYGYNPNTRAVNFGFRIVRPLRHGG